ncbi:transmembrane protein 74 [Gadus morhua]|uniref:transmembrane protein 74 n=1 Tax=Gadus morhua TaxID=8049 RepID=UPI0011B43034|nr:transmembrane protein 74-like [Gadus morhua]
MASFATSYYDHVEKWSDLLNMSPFTNHQSEDEVSDPCEKSLFGERSYETGVEVSCRGSAPRPAPGTEQRLCLINHRELRKHKAAHWEDETEQSFSGHDRTQSSPARNENLGLIQNSSIQLHEEDYLELFMLADQELGSEKSADYGFITGVLCLVTGISLVGISYVVPRDVRVDPDSVSAREMERLERENARVGAHLDRCVIAGLCLLTLGGAVLAMLLMVSMWRWESMRRKAFAYSKHAAKLYGSINLRAGGPTPLRESPSHLSTDLEALR